MAQRAQWQRDPKLRSQEQDPSQRGAAASQRLQVIAFVACYTEENLHQEDQSLPWLEQR